MIALTVIIAFLASLCVNLSFQLRDANRKADRMHRETFLALLEEGGIDMTKKVMKRVEQKMREY